MIMFSDEEADESIKDDDYNTVEGIEQYLAAGLEGLNRLSHDRHVAGYDRKERLNEYIILGHWVTDTCGNFMPLRFEDENYKIVDITERLNLGVIPRVFPTWEMKRYGLANYTASHQWSVPPVRIQCSVCKETWTLANAHDTFVEIPREVINLADYVGKTLDEVEAEFKTRTDAHYFLGSERSIRNDRLIDLTPDDKYEGSKVNERGWMKERDVGGGYVVQPGDETSFNKVVFCHKACQDKAKRIQWREYFEGVFREAGFTWVLNRMTEIPNGYCPCERCGPWFTLSTDQGHIEIGWRKRVINIDWSSTGKHLDHLFKDEDVTKGGEMIHAWGRDKAVKYLAMLRPHL